MERGDLRINNLYNFIDEFVFPDVGIRALAESDFLITPEISFNIINCIEPILLTKERLLQFGFEEHGKFEEKENFMKNYHVISVYNDGKIQWLSNDAFDEVELVYVHELQNLYFAHEKMELI